MAGFDPDGPSASPPQNAVNPSDDGSSLKEGEFLAEYVLTAQDYYCAAQIFWPRLSFWNFSPVVLVPMGAICALRAYHAWRNQELGEAALYLALGAIAAPIIAWLVYYAARLIRRWLILRPFKKERAVRVVFTQAGLKTADALESEVFVPWKEIQAFYDDGVRLIFLFNSKSFIVAPKNCFDEPALRALMRALYRWGAPMPKAPPTEDWLFEFFR